MKIIKGFLRLYLKPRDKYYFNRNSFNKLQSLKSTFAHFNRLRFPNNVFTSPQIGNTALNRNMHNKKVDVLNVGFKPDENKSFGRLTEYSYKSKRHENQISVSVRWGYTWWIGKNGTDNGSKNYRNIQEEWRKNWPLNSCNFMFDVFLYST